MKDNLVYATSKLDRRLQLIVSAILLSIIVLSSPILATAILLGLDKALEIGLIEVILPLYILALIGGVIIIFVAKHGEWRGIMVKQKKRKPILKTRVVVRLIATCIVSYCVASLVGRDSPMILWATLVCDTALIGVILVFTFLIPGEPDF